MRVFIREYFRVWGANDGFILLKMIHAYYEIFHLYKEVQVKTANHPNSYHF